MKLKIILIIIIIMLLIKQDKEHFFGSDWFTFLLAAIAAQRNKLSSVKGTYVRIYDRSPTYNEHWTTSEVGGLPYVYKTLCNTVQNKL